MNTDIMHIETIAEYNAMLGLPTVHPLVSVVDLSLAHPIRHKRLTHGFYSIFLKDVRCGDLIYGRQHYDYQEGTIVCLAPGQVIGIDDDGHEFQPYGMALLFHPNLLHGTSLNQHMQDYHYFSYEVNEALHISDEERNLFLCCLHQISKEISRDTDLLSKRLICRNIELLLDYCLRFYERQFQTRKQINHDLLSRFENLLNTYFSSKRPLTEGLPTVKYCANMLCLSPNYFGDLIKKETGTNAKDYIQRMIVYLSKERILDSQKSISQVAYDLGFKYPQHFTRMFKKAVGMTPLEFRTSHLHNS